MSKIRVIFYIRALKSFQTMKLAQCLAFSVKTSCWQLIQKVKFDNTFISYSNTYTYAALVAKLISLI